MLVGYQPKKRTLCELGQRIDDLLFERDMSVSSIADFCGCDRKTLYAIMESGECRLSTMIKIADFLNVSIDFLVYGKERGNGKAPNTQGN